MTRYSDLLDEGRIKRGRFSPRQVVDCLEIAKRDMKTAADVIDTSPEWAFNIACNAMHQAGRAFMFHTGYRTTGEGHHATVVRFLTLGLAPGNEDALDLMDRMRRKRNRATYYQVGTISGKEAIEAISVAHDFVSGITRLVQSSK